MQPSERTAVDAAPNEPASLRSERNADTSADTPVEIPSDPEVRKDSIDELILDLNRLYGEQR